MKFENIKAGDKVMAYRSFSGLYHGTSQSFWVPVKVEKVTPKQFYIEGFNDRFRKQDGSNAICGNSPTKYTRHVYKFGEVENQYVQAFRYIERIKNVRKYNSYIKDFDWKKANELDYEKAASLEAELFSVLSKHGVLKEADK